MKTKELKIQVPEGYEIDKENSTFEKIIFKKVENKLPESWEELKIINGFFVSNLSDIERVNDNCVTANQNKNVFPTKEEAEACIALAQLCQLRDRYNGDWKPDYNKNNDKYTIIYCSGKIDISFTVYTQRILSFKTVELRNKFLENFRDLIEIAKPLL